MEQQEKQQYHRVEKIVVDRMNRSVSPTCQSQAIGSFSQLAVFHNGVYQGGSHLEMMVTAEEDIIRLKKELRLRQAEFDKQEAILRQKNEQLEVALKETEIRLRQKEQMFESMLNSLRANELANSSQNIVAQIQASERQAFEEEIAALKEWKRMHQDDSVNLEKDYGRQLNDKDNFIKDQQLQIERLLFERSQQLFQWEVERKETQQRFLLLQSERDQAEAKIELKCQNRISELQMEIERLKLEHMREMERAKSDFEASLKDIKSLHEQEKQSLEYRLDRQSQDLKSLHHMVIRQDSETNDNKNLNNEHREQLTNELSQIAAEVDTIKSSYEATVAKLTKEKETAEERNAKLQKQLEKLKNAPKQPTQVMIDLPFNPNEFVKKEEQNDESVTNLQRQVKNLKQEVELLQGENEKLNDQVKKLRKDALDIHDYAERLEGNEKKLRQVLKDQATIEQEQAVELRRQINAEKKRAIEQSEILSQAKEALERENYRQATQLNEKDEQIRSLTKELRSHEKKFYDIQSMFNANPLNTSGFLNDQGYLRQGNNGFNVTQNIIPSQSNFSPIKQGQNFGNLQNPMMHSMQLPHLNHNQSFVSNNQGNFEGCLQVQAPNMKQITQLEFSLLKSCQRMADSAIRMECAHCFQIYETAEFHDHLILEHPQITNNINTSCQGLTKAHSQSQLIGINALKPPLNNVAQSQCLSSRSQNLQLYKTDDQLQDPASYLQTQGLNTLKPAIQSSPRVANKFIANSKSFTVLLKEIDEEEEKNLVGSIPANDGKVGRAKTKNLEKVQEREDEIEATGHGSGIRKSRNHHQGSSNRLGNGSIGIGGGSTVNLATTTMAGGTITSFQNNKTTAKKQSGTNISINSQSKNSIKKDQKSSNEKISSSKSCSSLHKKQKQSVEKASKREIQAANNITNEIKDLLDKLVSYQGSNTVLSNQETIQKPLHQTQQLQHCNSVALIGNNNALRQKTNLMHTESMVELRSSNASSLYVINCAKDNQIPNTDRSHHTKSKNAITKEKKVKEYKQTKENHLESEAASRKQQWEFGSCNNQQRNLDFSVKLNDDDNENHSSPSYHSSSPKKASAIDNDDESPLGFSPDNKTTGHNRPPSIGAQTARHTSKDTILSMPLNRFAKNKGRRYHEVNKSDVITPNSPRRYQDYFKHKPQPAYGSASQSAMLQMLLQSNSASVKQQNAQKMQQPQIKTYQFTKDTKNATPSLQTQSHVLFSTYQHPPTSVTTQKILQPPSQTSGAQTNMQQHVQNHRYSPSNTKSMVDESQYQNQLSPSPEKQTNKQAYPYQFELGDSRQPSIAYNMPLQQQLQNQLPVAGKASNQWKHFASYDSGTVLCGAPSDAILKSNQSGVQQNYMIGGFGFAPITNTTQMNQQVHLKQQHCFEGVNTSLEDDGEIRPSQLDEFAEVKNKNAQQKPAQNISIIPDLIDYGATGNTDAMVMLGSHNANHQHQAQNATSSYITIGEDDPFITGRFCDASVKQFNFKPPSGTVSLHSTNKLQQRLLETPATLSVCPPSQHNTSAYRQKHQ